MQHLIPADDFREHEASALCWCDPTAADGSTVHHAADHREEKESTGEQVKPWVVVEEPPFEN